MSTPEGKSGMAGPEAGDHEIPPQGSRHRPTEIRVKTAEKAIEIDFDDGRSFHYPAEYLRVESPSAEVKGHVPSQRKIVPGRRHVAILKVEPVGNYAIRIVFDDRHETGIYSWTYLYALGETYEATWRAYLEALAAKGLSRNP